MLEILKDLRVACKKYKLNSRQAASQLGMDHVLIWRILGGADNVSLRTIFRLNKNINKLKPIEDKNNDQESRAASSH